MVSQCKICGERTSGHRQYCPYCRKTSRYSTGMPEEFKFIVRLILSSVVMIPVFVWLVLLVVIFVIHYIIKTIVLLIKREKKKLYINTFERNLIEKMKETSAVGSKVNNWIFNGNNKTHSNRRSNWGQQRMVSRKILR